MDINELSGVVVDAAMRVHTALGAGLLESAYRTCLHHELKKRGVKVFTEVSFPVTYDGIVIDTGYRIDLLVEDSLIVELKSVEQLTALHRAQLLTYLRLTNKTLGLIFNFNSIHLKNGIIRVINSYSASSASSAPLWVWRKTSLTLQRQNIAYTFLFLTCRREYGDPPALPPRG